MPAFNAIALCHQRCPRQRTPLETTVYKQPETTVGGDCIRGCARRRFERLHTNKTSLLNVALVTSSRRPISGSVLCDCIMWMRLFVLRVGCLMSCRRCAGRDADGADSAVTGTTAAVYTPPPSGLNESETRRRAIERTSCVPNSIGQSWINNVTVTVQSPS